MGIWDPGRGLGGFSHQRTVVVMVTLGRHPRWLLLLGSPALGSGGRRQPGAARQQAVLLCPCCRPRPGFHRLPAGRGDAALLPTVGLLLLPHGGPSGTGQPGTARRLLRA